jgi:hypothetical protein
MEGGVRERCRTGGRSAFRKRSSLRQCGILRRAFLWCAAGFPAGWFRAKRNRRRPIWACPYQKLLGDCGSVDIRSSAVPYEIRSQHVDRTLHRVRNVRLSNGYKNLRPPQAQALRCCSRKIRQSRHCRFPIDGSVPHRAVLHFGELSQTFGRMSLVCQYLWCPGSDRGQTNISLGFHEPEYHIPRRPTT